MHFLTGEPLEFTFALIKPDAVENRVAGRILTMMELNFFVADVICAKWDPDDVALFYKEHKDKAHFNDLVKFMSSERMYAVTLVAPDAIGKWRSMIGATDPRQAAPHTVRGQYGEKKGVIMRNAVHGSDSAESAAREVTLLRRSKMLKNSVDDTMHFGDEALRLIDRYTGLVWSIDEKGDPRLTPR
jgi:nucleoside-diphosphate kinase